jgi:hypothetical protein
MAFSTITMITRTRLNVTLYVHCLYLKELIMGPQTQSAANQTDNFKVNRKSFEAMKRASNYFHEN